MSFRKLTRATAFILLVAVQGVHAATTWTGTNYMDSAAATGATKLHAVGITGKGVSVAVIDSPYAVTNSYISGNIIAEACYGISTVGTYGTDTYSALYAGMTDTGLNWIVGDIYGATGLDAVTLPNVTLGNATGNLAHGTHVSGTVVGMAPDSGLVLLSGASYVTNDGGVTYSLSMLENVDILMQYAADNAAKYNIVALNGSFGSSAGYYSASEAALADGDRANVAAALAALRDAGAMPVFAAGNESANNVLPTPAAMTDAVAVGSYGPDGTISEFSNLNSKVVLIAPGENILSSVPEWLYGGSELGSMQGTSMASPHVSGAVALLASGVRGASVDEIYQALLDSADVISADTMSATIRSLYQMMNLVDPTVNYPLDALDPLLQNEYRLLRVDKAYSLLSSTRARTIYEEVGRTKSPYADMYRAFANELGADVDDSAVIFQLLEALSLSEKIRVAREMSPVILAAGSETMHVATGDLHTALGRRMSGNRLNFEVQSDACEARGYPKPMPNTREWMEEIPGESLTVWAEGSGGWLNRDSTRWDRDYNSHHGGVTVGAETYIGDWTAGLVANVSRHEINGSGNLKSDVGTLGLYGSWSQGIWYVDGSLSVGWGNHDSERKIYIPGWLYESYDGSFIRYDDVSRTAKGNTNSLDFSGRVAGGALLYDWGDWRMNMEADLIGSYLSYDGYREKGADSLDLHLGRYNSSYLETGLTLGATRLLRGGERPLFLTAKLGARYGKMFDHGLSGKFRAHGSKFKVDPEMLSSFWATPELSFNWQITDQVFMYASYQGRFGEDRQGHTGRVGVEYAW